MFPEKWKSADWHRPEECYVEEDGDHIRIGNSIIERVLSREGGRLRTVSITNKLTNRTWNIEATDESRLTLGVAKFRFDIKAWRFAMGSKQPVSPKTIWDSVTATTTLRPTIDLGIRWSA